MSAADTPDKMAAHKESSKPTKSIKLLDAEGFKTCEDFAKGCEEVRNNLHLVLENVRWLEESYTKEINRRDKETMEWKKMCEMTIADQVEKHGAAFATKYTDSRTATPAKNEIGALRKQILKESRYPVEVDDTKELYKRRKGPERITKSGTLVEIDNGILELIKDEKESRDPSNPTTSEKAPKAKNNIQSSVTPSSSIDWKFGEPDEVEWNLEWHENYIKKLKRKRDST